MTPCSEMQGLQVWLQQTCLPLDSESFSLHLTLCPSSTPSPPNPTQEPGSWIIRSTGSFIPVISGTNTAPGTQVVLSEHLLNEWMNLVSIAAQVAEQRFSWIWGQVSTRWIRKGFFYSQCQANLRAAVMSGLQTSCFCVSISTSNSQSIPGATLVEWRALVSYSTKITFPA